MRAFASTLILGLAFTFSALSAVGCKSKDPQDRLFGDLDPPTPNKLAGVYTTTVDDEGMTTEIRLEFDDSVIIGAVKCTPKNTALPQVTVGGQIDYQTDNSGDASGKFTVAAFSMEKTDGDVYCQAGLRAATYDFKVEDLRLTLTATGIPEPIIYGKIGDTT